MQYQVVADEELPSNVDRVCVERVDDCPLLLVKRSAAPAVFKWLEERGPAPRTHRERAWRRAAR